MDEVLTTLSATNLSSADVLLLIMSFVAAAGFVAVAGFGAIYFESGRPGIRVSFPTVFLLLCLGVSGAIGMAGMVESDVQRRIASEQTVATQLQVLVSEIEPGWRVLQPDVDNRRSRIDVHGNTVSFAVQTSERQFRRCRLIPSAYLVGASTPELLLDCTND